MTFFFWLNGHVWNIADDVRFTQMRELVAWFMAGVDEIDGKNG